MQLKTTVKPNDELYGDDIELIPLNLNAVYQRIEYFERKVGEELERSKHIYPNKLNAYIKHRDFWKGIRENHCLETDIIESIDIEITEDDIDLFRLIVDNNFTFTWTYPTKENTKVHLIFMSEDEKEQRNK